MDFLITKEKDVDMEKYYDVTEIDSCTKKNFTYIVKSEQTAYFPRPTFGIIGFTPDMPLFPFVFQLAYSFENGLPLFKWGECMPCKTAILTNHNRLESLTNTRDELVRLYSHDMNTQSLVCPKIFYLNEDVDKITEIASSITKIVKNYEIKALVLDNFLSFTKDRVRAAIKLHKIATENNIMLMATYRTSILVGSGDSDALRRPLSFDTFGEDVKMAEIADWHLLGVQVGKAHLLKIANARDIQGSMNAGRFYALKFISNTVPVPYNLHFFRQSLTLPEMVPVEFKL